MKPRRSTDILAADASSFGYVGYTLESLATYDNKFNIVLRCLAKDIEVSPDGLVYTITIRPDLKWSDGSQVTADDYVYTLKNLMFSDWLNYNYKDDWQEEVGGKNVFVTPAGGGRHDIYNHAADRSARVHLYPV